MRSASSSSTEHQPGDELHGLREPHVGGVHPDRVIAQVFSNLSTVGVEHPVQYDLTDSGVGLMSCIPLCFFVLADTHGLF